MKAFLVIVPLYNKIQYLQHTLPSILNQEGVWVEMVIVDDNSTDGSYEWCVENFQGRPNVHILKNKKNIGCYQSRNRGLKYALDREISFYWWTVHDPDDWSPSDRFKTIQWYFDKIEDVQMIQSMYHRTIRETGEILNTQFCSGCAAFRKDVIDKLGYFDNTLRISGDAEYIGRFKGYYKNIGKDWRNYMRQINESLMIAYYDDSKSNLTLIHPHSSPERSKVTNHIHRIQDLTTNPENYYYPFNNKGWRH